MKRIAILGSTGSIGQNALKVARHLGSDIQVVAIAARENIDLLEEQARDFAPRLIAVYNADKALELQRRLPGQTILSGMEGLLAVASHPEADMVISAMAGTVGLQPTIEAIRAGKDVGLANKEALVSGGALIMQLVAEKGVKLLPIDSEHSAIFQCLKNEPARSVRRIILTSSGGPFRTWTDQQLENVTIEQALNHPTWKMGPKVTIDSSTLMNKGLEVIEAYWLFGVDLDQIDVVVHPQSIIHSLVEFSDYSMLAQMGEPSMIVPIQYAMTYPDRQPGLLKPFDFVKNSKLEFSVPNKHTFRCLALAYEALRQGGSLPCYMNAANEVLVERFLKGEISWKEIGIQLEVLMNRHAVVAIDSLDIILAVDALAREEAARCEVTSC
ncbi:1-deoxy-D-xylulose 5-phosphate reductoisomerase [Candidatus Protochlamydia naegleriophila]|uniref:1-deoxy-D-xylulose 5-phosphate reductoisomerase n=1 Tax=Candidatus Protochlamydia naegleriophila TaxID=389348 RepID=A0A0U5EPG2_9BACT|nr:1-deoxy-D-xylulose-5-phosphate reductoisomerase [Candidatus Protochlamydia naegleriophila]CUI15920.1 1-deoxy-D-xylulose 5-phosphate reductoisomerase [Candidatus Protochlamydia naegleriophila]